VQVSACHVRYLNPLPKRLGAMMKKFDHVLVPEMNLGQFRMILRDRFLVDAKGLNKVKGQPFTIHEVVEGVRALLAGRTDEYEVQVSSEDAGLDVITASTPGGG